MPLLAAAAAIVVVAAAAQVVVAITAAAEQENQNDDPPAAISAPRTVVTHNHYLRNHFVTTFAVHSMLFRKPKKVRGLMLITVTELLFLEMLHTLIHQSLCESTATALLSGKEVEQLRVLVTVDLDR